MSFRNESEFVNWLRRRWPERAPGLDLGICDDAAVVRARHGEDMVLTTDLSLENIHFRLDLHPPQSIGHRALARSLSDLAAMGAKPRFALLSLAFPRSTRRSWITRFYDGLGALAARLGVDLIGGDTAVTSDGPVIADVIAAGEVARGRALQRKGAKAGDRIYVTGRLGAAALGLTLLQRGARLPKPATTGNGRHAPLLAHLYPEPRVDVGEYLSMNRLATAAIDVSDGFARDLSRLCESSACGARIRQDRLPLLQSATALRSDRAVKRLWKVPPEFDSLELALYGGDDYELIFTVARSKAWRVPPAIDGVRIHEIGEVTTRRGLRMIAADGQESVIVPRGYDHFQR